MKNKNFNKNKKYYNIYLYYNIMSLSLEDYKKKNQIIAHLMKDGKIQQNIYYIDEDDLPENKPVLNKIRLNDPEESFFPIVKTFENEEKNERMYICGESGCGKSYNMIRKYAEAFHKKYPKSKVLLFTSKLKDRALDDLKFLERVNIDEDMISNPMSVLELAGISKPLLTIFDDIEDFPNKKVTKEIERLRDEVMRNGRSSGIYILYTHHDPCDYKQTKSQIFEASSICTFPRQSGDGAYNYLYEHKVHLTKPLIKAINNTKSKFVLINKGNPKYLLSDRYIVLL